MSFQWTVCWKEAGGLGGSVAQAKRKCAAYTFMENGMHMCDCGGVHVFEDVCAHAFVCLTAQTNLECSLLKQVY